MNFLIVVMLMCNPVTEQCSKMGTMSVQEVPNAEHCTIVAEEMNADYSQVWLKSLEGNVFGFQAYCDTKI